MGVTRTCQRYGFGRGKEVEPNSAAHLIASDARKHRNLLATGKRYQRAIAGEVCGTDEDVFPVNERVAVGDDVRFLNVNTSTLDVRFWYTQPCAFEDKLCTKTYQVFPKPAPDGTSPDSDERSFVFPQGSGAVIPPGGSKWLRLYMGVRRKAGPCNQAYSAEVEIVRGKGNEVYP